jgi:hypothetical protein
MSRSSRRLPRNRTDDRSHVRGMRETVCCGDDGPGRVSVTVNRDGTATSITSGNVAIIVAISRNGGQALEGRKRKGLLTSYRYVRVVLKLFSASAGHRDSLSEPSRSELMT